MTIGSSELMAGSSNIAVGATGGQSGSNASSSMPKLTDNMKRRLLCMKHRGRGVVYISHIPHGFYENEMNDFFKQFGTITNLLLARSKDTGKSKGYAYIEFMYAEIAKVVAGTMHNYLMNERLLKAKFIPSEDFNCLLFYKKHPTEKNFPRQENRKTNTQHQNKTVPLMGEAKAQKKREEQHENLMNKIGKEKPDFTFKVSDAYTNAELSDSSFDDNMKSCLAELDTSEEFQDVDVSNVTRRKRRNEYSRNNSVTFDLPSEKQDSSPPKKNRASIISTIQPDASFINSKVKTKKKNSLLIPSATKSMKIEKPSKKNDVVYESNDSTESPVGKNKKVFQNSVSGVFEEKHDTNNSLVNKVKHKRYNYSPESQNGNDTDEHSSDSSIQEVFTSKKSKKKKNVTNSKMTVSNKKLKSSQKKESADRQNENEDSAISSVCLSVPSKQKEVNLKEKDKNNEKLSKAKVQKQKQVLQDDKDKSLFSDQCNLSTSSITGNLLSQVLNNVSTPRDKKDHTSNINSENARKKKLIKDDDAKMFVPLFQPNIEVEKPKKRKKEKTGALNSLSVQTCDNKVEGSVEGQPSKLLDLSPTSIAKEVLAKVKKGNKKGNKKNNKEVSKEVNIITEKTNAKKLNNKTNDVDSNISSDQLESSLPVVGKKISGKGNKKKEKNVISDSVKNKTVKTKVISTKTADNTENNKVKSLDRPSLSADEIRDKLLTEALKGKKKKAKKTKNQVADIGHLKNAEDIVTDVLKENTDKSVSSDVEEDSSGRLSLSVSEIKDKLLTKALKKKKKTKDQTANQNDVTEVNAKKPYKESEVNETDASSKISKGIKRKIKKGANQISNTHFQMKVGTTEKTHTGTVDANIENKDKSPEQQSLSVIEIKDALLTKVLKEKKKVKKTGKQVSDVSVERVNNDIQQSVSKPDYVQNISALQSSLTSSIQKNDTEKIRKSKTKKGKKEKSSAGLISSQNVSNMHGDVSDNGKAEHSDKSLESSLSVSAIQDELLSKAFESKKSKKKKNKNKISEKSNDNFLKNTETAQILSKSKIKEDSQKDSVKTSKNKGLHNKENLKIDIDSLPLFSQLELAQKIKGNKLGKGKKESDNLHDISRKSNGKVNKISRKKSTKKIM